MFIVKLFKLSDGGNISISEEKDPKFPVFATKNDSIHFENMPLFFVTWGVFGFLQICTFVWLLCIQCQVKSRKGKKFKPPRPATDASSPACTEGSSSRQNNVS